MLTVETKVKVAIGLSFTFVSLSVVDILLTWQALQLGAVELNFYMGKVLALGFWESIAFKLGISCGITAVMLERGYFALLVLAATMASLICIWNFNVVASLS